MGESKLSGKILKDAEEDVRKVEEEILSELEEVEDRIKDKLSEETENILSEADRKSALISRKIIGGARISARVSALKEKIGLLDELFLEIESDIEKLSESSKKKVIELLLGDASAVGDNPVVLVADKYKKLVPQKFEVKKGGFTDFGVIIQSKDGFRKIDKRLKTVLENLREQHEHTLNKMIWS